MNHCEKLVQNIDVKFSTTKKKKKKQKCISALELTSLDSLQNVSDSDSDSECSETIDWDLGSSDEDEQQQPVHETSRVSRSVHLKEIMEKVYNTPQRAQSLESTVWFKQCMQKTYIMRSPCTSSVHISNNSSQATITEHSDTEEETTPQTIIQGQFYNTSVPNLSDDSAFESCTPSPEQSFHEALSMEKLSIHPARKPLLTRRNKQHDSEPNLQAIRGNCRYKRLQTKNISADFLLNPNDSHDDRILNSNHSLTRSTHNGENCSGSNEAIKQNVLLNNNNWLHFSVVSDSDEFDDDDDDSDNETNENTPGVTSHKQWLPQKVATSDPKLTMQAENYTGKSETSSHFDITDHDNFKALKSMPDYKEDLSNYFIDPDSDMLLEDLLTDRILFSQSHWVDFSNLRLLSLPCTLTSHKNVQALRLDGNWIQRLPEDIDVLPKLQCLSLRENFLYYLPDNIYKCRNLQWLNLQNNRLEKLPEEISALDMLSYLNLKCNTLIHWPQVINTMENLTVLDMSFNKHLFVKEGCLRNLNNLTWLSLKGTVLVAVPSEIGCCKKLQYVDLSNNFLRHLPSSMHLLQNLKILHLAKNTFGSVPNVILQLKSLEVLDLSDNDLGSIPEEIGNLENLKSLQLENSHLKGLPHSLTLLNELTDLNIQGNKIQNIPTNLSKLIQS